MPDLSALVALARAAAADAGAMLLDGQGRVRTSVVSKSTATDMVTEMDTGAERLILDRLLAARPDDAVLAEEGSSRAGSSGVRWVIDPLDGTTNYLYGLPNFAVAIGIEVDGVAVAGVIHQPATAETFSAIGGHGAFLNDHRVRVAGAPDLATALVGTGFPYAPDRRARHGAVVAQVLPAVRDIRRLGSAALDLCAVACGRLDAYFERHLGPWDLCAGAVIAAEAGAWVGGFDGGPPVPDGVIAAAPHLAPALRDLITRAESTLPPESGVESG